MKSTVILADGRFPSHKLPLSLLNNADRVICCDGAVEGLLKFGKQPSFIVGDMDSIKTETAERYKHCIIQSSEQETNDLTKAVNFAIQNHWLNIQILGATGLREDHAIGNISLLANYAQLGDVQMVTNYGIFKVIRKTSELQSFPGQQVSIFCLHPSTRLKSVNLKYDLKEVEFSSWWKGTLNESLADTITITKTDNYPVILFQTHEGKQAK